MALWNKHLVAHKKGRGRFVLTVVAYTALSLLGGVFTLPRDDPKRAVPIDEFPKFEGREYTIRGIDINTGYDRCIHHERQILEHAQDLLCSCTQKIVTQRITFSSGPKTWSFQALAG